MTLSRQNPRTHFLLGMTGGILGVVRFILFVVSIYLDHSTPVLTWPIALLTLLSLLLTGFGFFGFHLGLESGLALRTFQASILNSFSYLVAISEILPEKNRWPSLLDFSSGNPLVPSSMLFLLSIFVFHILGGLTMIRFGYDYSFGPQLFYTGIFYVIASFAILTPFPSIFLLPPAILSIYVFYSLASWID